MIHPAGIWKGISPNCYAATRADHLFGYTGREWDSDIGLQYNRARWYDPKQGRWISQDPIGFAAGDENLYRYVGNGPSNATDPSGLERNPYLFLLSGNHTSGEALKYLHDWKDVLETNVHGNTRNARIAIQQLTSIVADLELREKQARRHAAQPWFERATGVGVLKSLDKSTGYLPFVHEAVDVIDGSSQNFVEKIPIVGFFAAEVGAIDTSEHTGWAWEGQRLAFGVSTCSFELATGASMFRGIRLAPSRLATGAGYVDIPDPGAVARYARIVDSLDDATISQLSRQANIPENVIRSVKSHLFETVHPIQTAPGVVKHARFTPMNEIADVWESALRGQGRDTFRNLLGHEYLESTLMKHGGLPFRPLTDPSGMGISAHNLSPNPWTGELGPRQLKLWDEFLSR